MIAAHRSFAGMVRSLTPTDFDRRLLRIITKGDGAFFEQLSHHRPRQIYIGPVLQPSGMHET